MNKNVAIGGIIVFSLTVICLSTGFFLGVNWSVENVPKITMGTQTLGVVANNDTVQQSKAFWVWAEFDHRNEMIYLAGNNSQIKQVIYSDKALPFNTTITITKMVKDINFFYKDWLVIRDYSNGELLGIAWTEPTDRINMGMFWIVTFLSILIVILVTVGANAIIKKKRS